jgi:TPR repeat protein
MGNERAKRIFLGFSAVLSTACVTARSEVAVRSTADLQALKEQCNIESQSPADLEASCESGDKSSCACLVDLYLLSLSAPQMVDYDFSPKAIRQINKWWASTREDYVDACNGGEGEACANAFGMWLAKEFNSYGESKALEYMEKGCELNNAKSCFFLGSAWRSGYPAVPDKDEEKSYRAFKKACELGHSESCSQMNPY